MNTNILGKKSYTWESKTTPGKKGRIDHCLLSPNLVKHTQYVRHVSLGSHLTDHRAIELCIDWALAKKGQGIFRAKLGLERDPKYKKIIQLTIKKCLAGTLPDFNDREYLNGKLDQLDKLDETLDKLDIDLAKAFNETQTTNLRIAEDIQLIDEDQPQRILNELKQKESLLQTARETIESQIGVLANNIPDNNTLVKIDHWKTVLNFLSISSIKYKGSLLSTCVPTQKNRQGKAGARQ